MNDIPAGLMQALKNYDPNDDEHDADELAVMRKAGLRTDVLDMQHDPSVAWLLAEAAKVDKAKVVNHFIVGLETHAAHLRTALSAYAFALHFPAHDYVSENDFTCAICSAQEDDEVHFAFLNAIRYGCGAVLGGDPVQIAFFLQEHNAAPALPVTSTHNLIALFKLIQSVPASETPTQLLKKVRALPGLKLSVDEARYLLDALGHAGILQTPEHKGLFEHFTNVGLAPSKSRSSDWSYPVDFWLGEYGLDKDAVRFWFADHPDVLALI